MGISSCVYPKQRLRFWDFRGRGVSRAWVRAPRRCLLVGTWVLPSWGQVLPLPLRCPPTLSISAWSQGPGDQFLTCLLVSWPHFHTLTSKCHTHCVLFGTAIYPHPYTPSPPSPSSASPPTSPETCPALAPWAVHDAHGLLCQAVGPWSSLPAASTQSCASEPVFWDFQNHVLFAALEILMSTWSVLNPRSNVRSCPLSEGQGAGEESPKVRLGFFGLLLGHCCEREKG